MAEKESRAAERLVAEKLWLNFFNNVAFDKGLITEKERNQMIIKIDHWSGMASKEKTRLY